MSAASNSKVLVRNLGRIGYAEAWGVQRKEVFKRLKFLRDMRSRTTKTTVLNGDDITQEPKDVILLCEHNPVYTVGIRTKDYPVSEEERLKKLGADFFRTDRGGLITFHGPGQMVAYPILNLARYTKSIRWYVCQLEKCVIRMSTSFGLVSNTSPHTGVWIKDNKVAAIGIHSSRYITSHGLALNCNTDLSWYDHIVPCGIVGKGVTSLSRELRRDVTIDEVTPLFLKAFETEFNCHIESEDGSAFQQDKLPA
ncbi:octanoyl-[acyl-carrier-protein]:protein N-octanoyltransferase LIPT2, mitochondrial-like [Saccoglossus kowalevskii]|uniref:Octanoyl-[acyl-carrier-protein]:protein N-octanoyltransferase LIPT2, mitochondrial n=1 Tax=Saccoglossus kowalevskii TaxID=10224 RepID=A0ABM0GNZ3_SACKO|nr:PREDICTED: putative lipoyltransferase 2, mitochondrial-like [Saccoglossus kowalevskii]